MAGAASNTENRSLPAEPSSCMNKFEVDALRFLKYPNGILHTMSIPYPSWSSAQFFFLAQISHILLNEAMKYSTSLYIMDVIDDAAVLRSLLGCLDNLDLQCVSRKMDEPTVHLALETWGGRKSVGFNLTRKRKTNPYNLSRLYRKTIIFPLAGYCHGRPALPRKDRAEPLPRI